MESRCTKLKEIASFLMIKIQKWVCELVCYLFADPAVQRCQTLLL